MNAVAHEYVTNRESGKGTLIPGTHLSVDSIFSGLSGSTQGSEATRLPVRIISQFGAPRWILPADARRAIPVLQSWRPYSVKSRMKWGAIVGACRLRALHVLPGVRYDDLSCDLSYWGKQLQGYSHSWAMTAYIGNPSPTRKVLLFFIDEAARVRAVVKVPLCPAAKAAILNEVQVLNRIRGELSLPQVLFSDSAEGIAGQSWVEGKNIPRAFGREHLELLMRLVCERPCARLTERREQLETRIGSLSSLVDSSLVHRALSLLDIEIETMECVEHGDFTPWNMRRMNNGKLALIDWEWSVEAGYPWQDVCRYFYLQAYLFRDSGNVWNCMMRHPLLAEYRRRLDLSSESVRGLTACFLLRLLCGSQEEGDLGKVAFATAKIQELLSR